MNFLNGERMPPLALNRSGGGVGGARCDSPSSASDPFNDSVSSSTSSASGGGGLGFGGGGGGGRGGSSGYITCIDFFVPMDLACGPPDDLCHAMTPRTKNATNVNVNGGDETTAFPTSSSSGSGGGSSSGSSSSPPNFAASSSNATRNTTTMTKRSGRIGKKSRGLKSLLFGERPTIPMDVNFSYTPSIEYVKTLGCDGGRSGSSSPTASDGGHSTASHSPVTGGGASVADGSSATNSAFAAAAAEGTDNNNSNNSINGNVPQYSSSGYLVSSPSSPTRSSSLSGPDTKPRAVVDGIDCLRYNLIDREQRQEVATNLRAICNRLGPRRSRRMILPALDLLCDFEDSTLLIAQSLPAVFFACEGKTHADLFVSLIYDLCASPDPIVSSEAASAVKTILIDCRDDYKEVLEHFFPVLFDMSYSPWTSLRCASASTLALLARLAPSEEDRYECQQNFRYLCDDYDVTVRRAAIATLHEWLPVVSAHEWARFPLAYIDHFIAEKGHDTIHIHLIEAIVQLARRVGKSYAAQHLLAPTIALARNESWRVRFILSSHIAFLYDALSNDVAELMPTVLRLASDEEVQVRVSTAKQIGMISCLAPSKTVETTLVDVVYALGRDESPEVRAGVAKSVGQVVAACDPSVGRPLIMNVLVPLLSDTTVPLVQHMAIMSIAAMAPLVAERSASDLFALVVTQLQTASRSSTWRVRESVANLLHHFAGHLKAADQFDALMPIMLRLINDDGSAVRSAVVNGIPLTVERLGPAWGVKTLAKLIELLADPQKSKFYQRIQVCTILSSCLPILERDLVAIWVPPPVAAAAAAAIAGGGDGGSAPTATATTVAVAHAVTAAASSLSPSQQGGISARKTSLTVTAAASAVDGSAPLLGGGIVATSSSIAILPSPQDNLGTHMTTDVGGGIGAFHQLGGDDATGVRMMQTTGANNNNSNSTNNVTSASLPQAKKLGGGGGGGDSSAVVAPAATNMVPSPVEKHYSRLATEVRISFNNKVIEVISRLAVDKVLSVREACARLLVTIVDEAPALYAEQRDGWAAAVAARDDSARDIIVKSGIPMGSEGGGAGHAAADTNPF